MKRLHSRQLSVPQAFDLQRRLLVQVVRSNKVTTPHFIAGVDISARRTQRMANGTVVVLSNPELRVVETKAVQGRLDFPYIPGLLSFRESPLALAACEKLSITLDLILVDGQGVTHPRRFGLTSHLGFCPNTPTISCAKSLPCGNHEVPGVEPGSYTEITDGGETIGIALRTRPGVKPIYISIGHKVDLETAIQWVREFCAVVIVYRSQFGWLI